MTGTGMTMVHRRLSMMDVMADREDSTTLVSRTRIVSQPQCSKMGSETSIDSLFEAGFADLCLLLSSLNLARVSVSEKSLPSSKYSISMRVDCWLDKVCLAFLTSCLSLPIARRLVLTSVPVFFLYCLTK